MTIKKVTLLSLMFFLVYFIQYPLNDSLPGHADTFLNLSIFNDYYNRFEAYFFGENIGRAHFPVPFFQSYSELYIGEALIYMPFHIIGLDDIWSYYFFISILYALNSIGGYVFFRQFKINHFLSFAGGMSFACSAFALSQIELLNGIPYFFTFLAFASIIKFYNSGSSRDLVLTAVFTGIQMYFSAYIMIYSIVVLLMFMSYILLIKASLFSIKSLLKSLIIYLMIISPYVFVLLNYGFNAGDLNKVSLDNIHLFSLQFDDLWRPLNGNIFYVDNNPGGSGNLFRIVNHCFTGYLLIILGITGLFFVKGLARVYVFTLVFVGFFLSFGPSFTWDGKVYKTALYPLYNYFHLENFLRISSRAYSLVLIGFILSAVFLLNHSFFSGRFSLLSLIFLSVFALENVPLTLSFNHVKNDMILPVDMETSLKRLPNNTVIINLPSTIFSGKGYVQKGKDEHTREELFLYWQTIHKKNSVNGISSFVSVHRKKADEWIKGHQWDSLINYFDIERMYFIKDKVYYKEDKEVFESLIHNNGLDIETDNNDITIFIPKKSSKNTENEMGKM